MHRIDSTLWSTCGPLACRRQARRRYCGRIGLPQVVTQQRVLIAQIQTAVSDHRMRPGTLVATMRLLELAVKTKFLSIDSKTGSRPCKDRTNRCRTLTGFILFSTTPNPGCAARPWALEWNPYRVHLKHRVLSHSDFLLSFPSSGLGTAILEALLRRLSIRDGRFTPVASPWAGTGPCLRH